MTKDEAQELIEEFRSKSYFKVGEIASLDGGHLDFKDIEKIINRFANKPPENGYESTWFSRMGRVYVTTEGLKIDFEKNVHYKEHGKFSFDAKEFKDLRDNIDKMLAYLEQE